METQVLIILGERFSGKSTVGRLIREMAGVGPWGDLEFSDFMIEATNIALAKRARSRRWFAQNLIHGASWVLDRQIHFPSMAWFGANQTPGREHQALLKWIDQAAPDLRLTRDNKIHHLAPLIWLGYFTRQPELLGPDCWGQQMAAVVAPLVGKLPVVTVGGARDPGDVAPLKAAFPQALTVKIRRDEVKGDLDPTNQRHREIIPDAEIFNDGDLIELESSIKDLFSDLMAGQLSHRDCRWYGFHLPEAESMGLTNLRAKPLH